MKEPSVQALETVVVSSPVTFSVKSTPKKSDSGSEVEFPVKVKNFKLENFRYLIEDVTSGKKYSCPRCKANTIAGKPSSLSFTYDLDVEVLKGKCYVIFPLSSVATESRILQQSGNSGYITIDEIYVPNSASKTEDKQVFIFYTFVNAFRFLSTIWLSILATSHVFWSTYTFSWLQIWSYMRGPYMHFADRYLVGHSNWYLLVINFGDPFKNFNDWDGDSSNCKSSDEYPLEKLGCSFTQNFGQNFIVIMCVLAFCLLMSIYIFVRWLKNKNQVQNKNQTKLVPQTKGTSCCDRLQYGLGHRYFLRWINALQPSIIFFSFLHFSTHKATPKMALGAIISTFFLAYYVITTALGLMLSRKLMAALKKFPSYPDNISLEILVRQQGNLIGGVSYYFSDLKRVTHIWQLQGYLIEFIATLLTAVFIVAVKDAQVSLGLIFGVQLLKWIFGLCLFKVKISRYYAVQDDLVGFLFLIYLILKLVSTTKDFSENNIHNIGTGVAVIVVIIWILCIIDICFSTVRGIIYCLPRNSKVKNSGFEQAHSVEITNHNITTTEGNQLEIQNETLKNEATLHKSESKKSVNETVKIQQAVKAHMNNPNTDKSEGNMNAQRDMSEFRGGYVK